MAIESPNRLLLSGYLAMIDPTTQQPTSLYISAYPTAFQLKGISSTILSFLLNPYDTAVSSYLPYVTVTLTYGNDVVYELDIAFNTASPITLGPREERTIYDRSVTLTGNVQKGSYWLQAEGGWCWAPEEGLPTEKNRVITLPTLIALEQVQQTSIFPRYGQGIERYKYTYSTHMIQRGVRTRKTRESSIYPATLMILTALSTPSVYSAYARYEGVGLAGYTANRTVDRCNISTRER